LCKWWCILILNFLIQWMCVAALQSGPARCRSWWHQCCIVEFQARGDWCHH
jgi:hypothetical protein